MDEPFLIVRRKRNVPSDSPESEIKKEKLKLYAEYRSDFNKLTANVINEHNEADFAKATTFLHAANEGEHPQKALPTCLLVNKSDFANTKDQISSFHEYLRRQKFSVVRLDGVVCDSLKKCIVLINNLISPAKTVTRKLKSKCKGSDDEEQQMVEEVAEDTWFENRTQLHVFKASKTKWPIVILIGNITSMQRVVLNDLLHLLIANRAERGVRFNIALGISGSLDAFHTQVGLSLVTTMCVKVVPLPSVRDSILAIIESYILGKDYLIQLDVAHICWIYQQVLMYNLSMNSFKKIFLYIGFNHIYNCPLFFLCRRIEDPKERLEYYKKMIGLIPTKEREHVEHKYFIGGLTPEGLEDLQNTHNEERKKFQKVFGLIAKVVLEAYSVSSRNIFRARLMQKMMALSNTREKTKAVMRYFQTVQNYREFATTTLPGLMNSPEYEAERSMLKTRCESRPSALGSVMKDGYSALPAARIAKLCQQPGATAGETEKTELNYRNDIGAWINDLLQYAFGELPQAVSFCYYPGDLNVTQRLNPDMQGLLIAGIMAEGEDIHTIVTDKKSRKGAPARKDLRLVLQIAKGLGKDVSLDEVMKAFEGEYIKELGYSEIRTKCVAALLYLRNSGFFAQAGRMLSVWRKTFFGKANFHAKFY